MSEKPIIKVRVVNAEKVMIDCAASSITASNRKGRFDVLPDHTPFICVLSAGDVLIRKPDKSVEQVTVNKGIFKFVNNEAVILTGI